MISPVAISFFLNQYCFFVFSYFILFTNVGTMPFQRVSTIMCYENDTTFFTFYEIGAVTSCLRDVKLHPAVAIYASLGKSSSFPQGEQRAKRLKQVDMRMTATIH